MNEDIKHDFEVREVDTETRKFSGVAVPFNQEISVGGITERFERGAIEGVEDVKLFWNHKEPIGKITRGEETDEGFVIDAVISRTQQGDDAYQLLRDGVINKLSVGFQAVKNRKEEGVIVRERVNLKEVSLVSFPAYSKADVLSVRETDETQNNLLGENTMNEENTEVTELREQLVELSREVSLITDTSPTTSAPASFRSYGDFVKAVAAGDEAAVEMTRLYAGAVVSPDGPDSIGRDAWVNEALLLVDMGRPSLNSFRKAGLPEAGLNIDFPSVKTNTLDVATQAAQGDTLTFGKLSLETKTTPVKTIGGWSDVSRQTIERSSVAYLSEVFRAMAISYGKETNAQFVTALAAGSYAEADAAAGTAQAIVNAVADASISIYTQAAGRPQFILASPDVWKQLVGLFAVDGRPIVGGDSPVNNIGSSTIPTMSANILGLEVVVDPALPVNTCYIANSNAITTWENGGPTRLSDEDITNLTTQFSVYGYIAFGLIYPEMIVSVTGLGTEA